MKTKQEHATAYQQLFVFWKKFLPMICIVETIIILLAILSAIFLYGIQPWGNYLVMIVLGILLSWVIVSEPAKINNERKNVWEKIASLKTKVEEAQKLYEQNTKELSPIDFTADHLDSLNTLKDLQNKLYKKQAYFQMIGGIE
ncbi:MAG: hypothetical protein WC606_03045 [Candidatus Absconditabacterales bacterium]|jgi:uncharacterized membrane protein (DUF106 family)